ncbi:chemotaxis protein CheW [Stakelama tenebrarum]|uniref:Purine-binding chemotaxis protein CheW n=1 Tax=Stakelama tenebrarum TaxID=2711215 RepID=A0A6G6Y487_9SPHN|nr:chemotaxis protein CheW [Sphingosinithalassobacter tenebrarum]QIG79720.1 purine-binding chemotaxis protein CheW [Sphingosinithalassobacter tenebrarum]
MSNTDTVADRKIVTFTLGKQIFGIDMTSLIEIREWEDPTPLPSVPPFIKGVTNLRGNVIPVVGLSERLGWEPSVIHPRSCILVVSISGKQAGFLVDEVTDIVAIGSQEVQPAPDVEIGEPSVIQGLVRITARGADGTKSEEGQMVLLLDLDALSLTKHLDLAA